MSDDVTISAEDYQKRSRRSFLGFGAGAVAAFGGWRWLQGRPEDGNVPDLLRDGYEFNEDLWQAIGDQGRLAPTYELDEATDLRVNGRIGLDGDPDPDLRIEIVGPDGATLEQLDPAVVDDLPPTDIVVEHKCIEGWSAVPRWTGAAFSELAARYADDLAPYDYVAMSTPDGRYYVGVDRPTMLNAQSLLVRRLNGEPLTADHGAPLRLATPHKYGIKSLKRIGRIELTTERPPDYWAERGYTYWAGF